MIDGSEKRNRQLAFELQNSHVCEKRSNINILFFLPFSLPSPSSLVLLSSRNSATVVT